MENIVVPTPRLLGTSTTFTAPTSWSRRASWSRRRTASTSPPATPSPRRLIGTSCFATCLSNPLYQPKGRSIWGGPSLSLPKAFFQRRCFGIGRESSRERQSVSNGNPNPRRPCSARGRRAERGEGFSAPGRGGKESGCRLREKSSRDFFLKLKGRSRWGGPSAFVLQSFTDRVPRSGSRRRWHPGSWGRCRWYSSGRPRCPPGCTHSLPRRRRCPGGSGGSRWWWCRER